MYYLSPNTIRHLTPKERVKIVFLDNLRGTWTTGGVLDEAERKAIYTLDESEINECICWEKLLWDIKYYDTVAMTLYYKIKEVVMAREIDILAESEDLPPLDTYATQLFFSFKEYLFCIGVLLFNQFITVQLYDEDMDFVCLKVLADFVFEKENHSIPKLVLVTAYNVMKNDLIKDLTEYAMTTDEYLGGSGIYVRSEIRQGINWLTDKLDSYFITNENKPSSSRL